MFGKTPADVYANALKSNTNKRTCNGNDATPHCSACATGRSKDSKMATIESIVEDNREPEKPIDREKTCPLLLRVFCCMGRHHVLSEYSRGNTPANELQIYTWMDATLKELTSLVKEVNVDARKKGTFFDFAIVYPDLRTPVCRVREIGSTCSGRKGADDNVTLASKRFEIGDYIDIAIQPPRSGPPAGGGGRGPPNRGGNRPRPY